MARYPENTWLGLQAAIKAGACWLEFDVQMCSDGEFILLHDGNFERTAGIPHSVFDTNKQQRSTISVHEPRRFGNSFSPLEISSLDEALVNLSAYPGIDAMIEIKQESLDHCGLNSVMDALLEKLNPFSHQCVLISYSYQALNYAREHSSIDIGWVLHRYDTNHLHQARELNPGFLICNEQKIPDTETPWPGTWKWMLYDISDPELAMQWASRGVELIETRDIGAMLQHPLLSRKACRHDI